MHELKPKLGSLDKIQDILDRKKSDVLAELDEAKQNHDHIVATHYKVETFAKKFIEELNTVTKAKVYHRHNTTGSFTYKYVSGFEPYRLDMELKFKVAKDEEGRFDFDNLKGTMSLSKSGRIDYINSLPIESVAQCAAPILIAKQWANMKKEVDDTYISTREKIKEASQNFPYINKEFLTQF